MTTDQGSQTGTLQILFDSLAAHGEATAVVAPRDGAVRRWSHAELNDTARRLAGGLAADR